MKVSVTDEMMRRAAKEPVDCPIKHALYHATGKEWIISPDGRASLHVQLPPEAFNFIRAIDEGVTNLKPFEFEFDCRI